MLDQRQMQRNFSSSQIEQWCHRRFGIGADGLIILRPHAEYDFEMIYYNSDGRISSMCGNGGRAIVRFAADLGLGQDFSFIAVDGPHRAVVEVDKVRLQMQDGLSVKARGQDYFTDTGSPHHVVFHSDPEALDLVSAARAIRYAAPYTEAGVNVNFVALRGAEALQMRTYERGVEAETYSCGTGVTAAALSAHYSGQLSAQRIAVQTRGGDLAVSFEPPSKAGGLYRAIWLEGPAQKVFEGQLVL